MMKREPFVHGVFEDIEVARTDDGEARMRARYVARSLITVSERW